MISGYLSAAGLPTAAQGAGGSRPVLEYLARRLLQDAGSAKAPATLQKHAKPWKRYERWVNQVLPELTSVYVVPGHIAALYLTSVRMSAEAKEKGPSVVLEASAAIACFNELAGMPSPTDHPACALVRETAKRTLQGSKLHREPLSLEDTRALVTAYCHPAASLPDRMHATAFALMFQGLLRYDDAAKILVHQDLLVIRDNRVEMFIYKSKTDQAMDGHWVTLMAAPGQPHCPVKLVRELLRAGGYQTSAPAGEDVGPLLRAVRPRGNGHQLAHITSSLSKPIPPLSAERLRKRLRELGGAIGIHKELGLHSCRIGGASEAAERHVPDQLIQQAGRWRSARTQQHYVRHSLAHRAAVSSSLAQ